MLSLSMAPGRRIIWIVVPEEQRYHPWMRSVSVRARALEGGSWKSDRRFAKMVGHGCLQSHQDGRLYPVRWNIGTHLVPEQSVQLYELNDRSTYHSRRKARSKTLSSGL